MALRGSPGGGRMAAHPFVILWCPSCGAERAGKCTSRKQLFLSIARILIWAPSSGWSYLPRQELEIRCGEFEGRNSPRGARAAQAAQAAHVRTGFPSSQLSQQQRYPHRPCFSLKQGLWPRSRESSWVGRWSHFSYPDCILCLHFPIRVSLPPRLPGQFWKQSMWFPALQ